MVIFVGAILKSSAFPGLIVPGENLALVTKFLAAQGELDLDVLIVTVAIGAVFGDSIGYEMGRRLGRPALLHFGSHLGLNSARVDKADAFFARHGSKAVFLGRFVGFARRVQHFGRRLSCCLGVFSDPTGIQQNAGLAAPAPSSAAYCYSFCCWSG